MALSLLLIDDDASDREAVRRAIRAAGLDASITDAATADAAEAAVAAQSFDCILLDCQRPSTDGLAVLAGFRAGGIDTPVVALTGHADRKTAVAMMKGGAADYLTKDALSPEGLERSIRHAMRVAASERERRDLLAREQAALAEARAANRARDDFLAALSHELRTPLNSILGWTHLLASGALDPAAAPRALETIQRNARLQAELIDDLLDVSRIVSGKLTVERRPVAIGDIVRTAVDSQRPAAAAARVELRYSAPDRDRPVLGDRGRLQQVVTNLLSNALKFTHAGGLVDVSLAFDAARVTLTVRDSGVGIDPDFLPHVFEQFRQADVTTTRRQGGLGLGLAIVGRIVELHDGSIDAQSAGLGSGATFAVTLPLAMGASAEEAAGTMVRADLAGLSILVVDDDADGRSFVATLLEGCGARVRTASSGAMALAAAAAERPDVLLSDIAMPDGDGYSLVARLRAVQPGVRAIAMTACVSPEDRLRAISAGFEAHVPKPVDPAALVSTILAIRPSTSSA